MRICFDRIPLDEVSLLDDDQRSRRHPAAPVELVAEEQGVEPANFRGTVQNDMLKEFVARDTYIFPLDPNIRLTTDLFPFSAEHSRSGTDLCLRVPHAEKPAATAAQEVAFTLSNGIAYVETAARGGA